MAKHNYYVDILRIVLAIGVFAYHKAILPGGFLAVCGFFVITGYYTTKSLNSEDINLKKYYLKRLKKIYLPLLVVALTTVLVFVVFNITWVSLKPETTSVLFGYNNFWQILSNNDYFVRNSETPFIHFWYIAILIQFELVFPIVYINFKKIFKNSLLSLRKTIVYSITLISILLFIYFSFTKSQMSVYYGSIARLFSLLLGVSLYYFDFREIKTNVYQFIVLLIIIIIPMFINVSTNKYYGIIMLGYSLLSALILMVALNMDYLEENKGLLILKTIAQYTYEFYLVQCPVIYILNNYGINSLFIDLLASIVIAFIIHTLLNTNIPLLKYFGIVSISLLIITGGYYYVTAKDYTNEINALKDDLAQSEQELLSKQQEYLEKKKSQENDYNEQLSKLIEEENNIDTFVENINITGVGDSILLGISNSLADRFNNIYIDAKVSRSGLVVPGILQELKDNDSLGDVILVNCAINGGLIRRKMAEIMDIAGPDREVFFANIHNTSGRWNDYNNTVEGFISDGEYPNAHLLDWKNESVDYDEYFAYDGIHMGGTGGKLYAQFFFDELSNFYKEKIAVLRKEIEDEHLYVLNNQYTFIGNDLLLGLSDYLTSQYPEANYISVNNDCIQEIIDNLNNDTINHNCVLCLDSQCDITNEDLKQIIENSGDRELYFVNVGYDIENIQNESFHIIDASQILDSECYSYDFIHLNEIGNNKLYSLIINTIEKSD